MDKFHLWEQTPMSMATSFSWQLLLTHGGKTWKGSLRNQEKGPLGGWRRRWCPCSRPPLQERSRSSNPSKREGCWIFMRLTRVLRSRMNSTLSSAGYWLTHSVFAIYNCLLAGTEKSQFWKRLDWWRQRRPQFLTLWRLARKFLYVPATSTQADRVFSGLPPK